jgi:DnaD/phage-associated family protein
MNTSSKKLSGGIVLNFTANSGIWGSMFGVPCVVADNFLKLATGEQIKVLLYLLRNNGRNCSDEEIAKNTGVSPEQVADAVTFWQQVNVISGESPSPVQNENLMSPPAPQPAEPEKKPVVSESKKPFSALTRKHNLHASEIAMLMKDSEDISDLFKTAESILGMLNNTQQNSLLWMYNYLGLKKEVIITLLSYCVSIEKSSLGYIEKIACDWSENEINSLHAAQERVSTLKEAASFAGKVRSIFSLSRQLTKNETAYVSKWQQNKYSFELIQYAYELTIEYTSRPAFNYADGILENWRKNGYTTVSQAREAKDNYGKKKSSENNSGSDNFDVDKYKIFVNNF